jgi:hypothetical protein
MARHGRMVELVGRMLDKLMSSSAHKQLAAERNPQVKVVLQRQIEAERSPLRRWAD